MLKSSVFVLSASFALIAACGPSSPKDGCNDVVATYCAKLYKCVDASAIQGTFGYNSEDDCKIKAAATPPANCSNLPPCPTGRTFDSSQVTTCENDINNSACINNLGFPPSCDPTTWCK